MQCFQLKHEIGLSKTQALLKIYKVSESNKAEAAYFTSLNGERSGTFVIDMPSADMEPAIAEPFFEMGARVEVQPVMNFEDLKKGLSAAIK